MFFLSSIATAISLGIPNTLIVFRTKFLNKESLVAVQEATGRDGK
jgi:hypothetical protein